MTRVLLWPPRENQPANHGIGRVVTAQYQHLPRYGVELVSDPSQAEVIACHTQQEKNPRVDVLHLHGLYWIGDVGSGEYTKWHDEANQKIIASARRARLLTVPSQWVAGVFRRDMRVSPRVIGHGLDLAEWTPGVNGGYVLWNKNRDGDVCDPTPAYELAKRGVRVVTTFAPRGVDIPSTLRVVGALSHDDMRTLIRNADVYLATTKETFGIGTLEAMACGVPVLGYNWGGTAEIVRHGEDGYLVRPGDIDGLMTGLELVRGHRKELSHNAMLRAGEFSWGRAMAEYAEVYEQAARESREETNGVAVVVTNYNYVRYLGECLDSILAQSVKPAEIVIVDDGSTDDSLRVIEKYKARGVKVISQDNQGVAHARNRGVMETCSPFVACIDADDKLYPRYVEACRDTLMRDRGAGIAWGGLTVVHDDGRVYHNSWPGGFDWEWQASAAIPPNTNIPTGAMFRRAMWERAGGYRQEYAPGEDAEFYTRGLSVGFTAVKVTDDPLLIYRNHGGGAHAKRPYVPIDDFLPWMRDRQYPIGAPSEIAPTVRSYSEPLVSVVIPVGPGHTRYVPQALDSLLGQTMREWEVIVVNDSEEDLPIRPYPFAKVIDIGKGRGAGEARNEGVHFARAPLVFFLDADDYLHHDALNHLCKAYAAQGGRYVYSDWKEQTERGLTKEILSPTYDPLAWVDFDDLGGKHIVSVLMATEDARKIRFDEDLPAWEDWDFFIRCAQAGIAGYRLAESLIIVRRLSGSRTEKAFSQRGKILGALKEKYKGVTMSNSCCGGNGDALLAAKRAWANTPTAQNQLSVRITARGGAMNNSQPLIGAAMASAPDSGVMPVRMEFIGNRTGAVTYAGLNGRTYRGGNNQLNRFGNIHPDDVQKLASTGQWRVVGMIQVRVNPDQSPVEVKEIPQAAAPKPEPVKEKTEPIAEPTVSKVQAVETGDGVVKRKRVKPASKNTALKDVEVSA